MGFRANVKYRAPPIGLLTGWVLNVGHDLIEAVAERSVVR